MPAVFVHGVPDTSHVWEPLRKHLSRKDVIALSLPGFGTVPPEGFTATKEEYVHWIIMQLEAIGEPVDLVGHDWGCVLVARVVSLRPDLIRSWAAGDGPVSGDYEWHPLAKIWQMPGEGEKFMSELTPAGLANTMMHAGVPNHLAGEAAARVDDTMKQCILRLYRSAIDVGREWQPHLCNVQKPGLVFWGEKDSACPVRFAYQLALNANASRAQTFSAEHWVILERSSDLAKVLESHWDAVQA